MKSAKILTAPPAVRIKVADRHDPVGIVLSQLYSIGVHILMSTTIVPIVLCSCFSKLDFPE